MSDITPITVALVLHASNRGWILEKFARRLSENLSRWGVEAQITDGVVANAALHHFMMYMHGPTDRPGPSTALITHVDRPHKVLALRRLVERVDVGICLSHMTVEQLIGLGLPAEKLCFVVPGCDPIPEPRRTVIHIATRLYRDLRKREDLLLKLASAMRLENFRFEIFGLGWEKIAARLGAAGAEVVHQPPSDDYQADHKRILTSLRGADYYFYPGLDEGSMGLMDALAVGVPTISTPQGFHLDIPSGLTHAFWDFPEMLTIFQRLASERQDRIDAIGQFSWDEYARRHAVIWRAILQRKLVDFGTLLDPSATPAASRIAPSRGEVALRWSHLFVDEGKRLGSYLLKSVKGQTQPSDARPRNR